MAFFDHPPNCPPDQQPVVQLVGIVCLFLLPLSPFFAILGALGTGLPASRDHPLAALVAYALAASPYCLLAGIVLSVVSYWFYSRAAFRMLVALPITWWAVFGVGCIGLALSPQA